MEYLTPQTHNFNKQNKDMNLNKSKVHTPDTYREQRYP